MTSIREELADAMMGVQSADMPSVVIFAASEEGDRTDALALADVIISAGVVRIIKSKAFEEGFSKCAKWYEIHHYREAMANYNRYRRESDV